MHKYTWKLLFTIPTREITGLKTEQQSYPGYLPLYSRTATTRGLMGHIETESSQVPNHTDYPCRHKKRRDPEHPPNKPHLRNIDARIITVPLHIQWSKGRQPRYLAPDQYRDNCVFYIFIWKCFIKKNMPMYIII